MEKENYNEEINALLIKTLRNIELGNSNLDENGMIKIIETINDVTDNKAEFSLYSAIEYLGVSRSTFINYIDAKLIPSGKHIIGFKEVRWKKSDLDKFKKNNKKI